MPKLTWCMAKSPSVASWGHRRPFLGIILQEPGRAGTLCPPGIFPRHSRLPPSAASEDVPAFLMAPPPSLLPEGPRAFLPPTQAHPTRRTSLAARHSPRWAKGSHAHLCLALHQPRQAPGIACPPLGKREGGEEGEQSCLWCWAGGPVLGARAQTRETLTAWRRLSSFSSSSIEGSRVTRALLAPSGVLCTGKGEGESQAASSLSSGSSARDLPSATGAPLPSHRAVFPHLAAPAASPRLTPAVCPATAPSAPGSCSKRGERASGPAAPQPLGGAGACRALPHGEGHRGRRSPSGSGQRCCPSPGSLWQPQQLLLPFPFGEQRVSRGCRRWQGPLHHPKVAPPLTQKWQCRSRWARRR